MYFVLVLNKYLNLSIVSGKLKLKTFKEKWTLCCGVEYLNFICMKIYICSHKSSLHKISFYLSIAKLISHGCVGPWLG